MKTMIDIIKILSVALVIILGGIVAMAVAAELDVTWNPQPGQAIRSSDIRGMITQIEASVNSVDHTQLADSAVYQGKLDSGSVTRLVIANNAIEGRHFNYIDSTTWDTMPTFMVSGTYTGDSNVDTGYRVYALGLHPVRIEIMAMTLTGCAKWTQDIHWDTTAAFCEYSDTRIWSDTSTASYGAVRLTRQDTEFVVYNVRGLTITPNILNRKYAYTIWGVPK